MRLLLCLLFLKGLALALLINYAGIGLAPDEAQYWTWSQALDWGYYSKPPGIAWQIWGSTAIFGNTEFGIRFGALCVGFLLPLVIYAMAYGAGMGRKIAFWSAIIMAFSPLGIYLSFAATTDGGAILFLTCAIALLVHGAGKKEGPDYILAGACIALGALFKWTAFVFWPFVVLYLFFFPHLRKKTVITGLIISLLGLLPTLYWNAGHHWATFRHVGNTVQGGKGGNFLEFFAAQWGLLSPLFFLLLAASYLFLKKANRPALYCAAGFPALVVIYLFFSLFKKMQPNWAAYLYPPGFMLAAWTAGTQIKWGKFLLHLGTWLALVSTASLFAIPRLQDSGKLDLPYKWNPFRQSVGWKNISPALLAAGYQPENDFLFADKYQTASLLSFYAPRQKRAYFFNIGQSRKNQFSYWPQMEEKEVGKTGYFAVFENTLEQHIPWYEQHYKNRLQPYFKEIRFKKAYPLFHVSGEPVKYAIFFECIDYNGSSPDHLEKY